MTNEMAPRQRGNRRTHKLGRQPNGRRVCSFPQIVSGMTSRDPIRNVSLLCKLGEVEHANTCGSWRYEGSFPFCMLTSAFVIVSEDNDIVSSKICSASIR